MALRGLVFGFYYLEITASCNPIDPVTQVPMVYFAALSQNASLLHYIDQVVISLEKILPVTQGPWTGLTFPCLLSFSSCLAELEKIISRNGHIDFVSVPPHAVVELVPVKDFVSDALEHFSLDLII